MIINQPNLQALRTSLELRFREGYEQAEAWAQRISTEIPSNSKTSTYGWMADQVTIREWIGPRIAQAMSEHEYVLANVPFEATLKIPRDNILDDNLGIYTSVLAPQFGNALAKHPDRSIVTRVFDTNPTAFDGQALWSDAHPCYDDDGTTYDNDFALALPADDLWTAYQNVITVRSEMRTRIGENGEILEVNPRLLVVPPQKEHVAIQLATADKLPMGASSVSGGLAEGVNTLKGLIDYLVVPELAHEPDYWYMFDDTKPLKAIIWQVRSQPVFRSFDTGTEMHAFMQNEYVYGIDGADGGSYRANAGVSLPFLTARSGSAAT